MEAGSGHKADDMRRHQGITGLATVLAAVAALAWGQAQPPADANAKPKKPDNLDYWLTRAKPTSTQSASRPSILDDPNSTADVLGTGGNFRRDDVVPGVVEMSNGQRIAGWMYTTRDRAWELGIGEPPNYICRRVPFAAALSIQAIIFEANTQPVWRWKEMGQPEKVFTGEAYPQRRMGWRIKLADGSTLEGKIKGQPLWVETPDGNKVGPMILQETTKGAIGQTLEEFIYVKQVIVSRRLMDQVAGTGPKAPASRPASGKRGHSDFSGISAISGRCRLEEPECSPLLPDRVEKSECPLFLPG
jgi:hypothetical protein